MAEIKKDDKLGELYKRKGEIITNIELLQNQLQQVNQEILKELGLLKNANRDETTGNVD